MCLPTTEPYTKSSYHLVATTIDNTISYEIKDQNRRIVAILRDEAEARQWLEALNSGEPTPPVHHQ